jgi:flagellar hook protein FlgE
MQLNLDSTSATPPAFSAANPSGTSNYSTSMTVYDSLGAPHRADVYFRNQGGGNFEWHAMVDGGEVTGGTAGTPTEIANGTMTFDTAGKMTASATAASSASFVGAKPNQAIAFDFTGTSSFASASSVNALNQDGYGAGSLTDVAISDDGTITGKFSNGQSRDIARVALANFASDDGLHRVGNQLFSATDKSGSALVDAASTGGRGSISSGSLETSNVDLASELVTLIAYQRAFSANSKTVQTADEMLQEVSNLKR